MEKEFYLDRMGPCGLLCEKCFAYENGPVRNHAAQLQNYLGNFGNYAKRFSDLLNEPVFNKYPEFSEVLSLLSKGSCKGCRKQDCHLFSNCKVKQCHKEKSVDFCFECSEFPCKTTGFDENLYSRWILLNNKIREIGLSEYYNEIREKPRY